MKTVQNKRQVAILALAVVLAVGLAFFGYSKIQDPGPRSAGAASANQVCATATATVPDQNIIAPPQSGVTADSTFTSPEHVLSRDGAPIYTEPGELIQVPGVPWNAPEQTILVPGATDTKTVCVDIPPSAPAYPASFYTGPAGASNPLPPPGKAFFGVTPPNNSCGVNHDQLCSTWQEQVAGFQFLEGQVGQQFNLISDFQQQTCALNMARVNGMRAEALLQLSWQPNPNKPDQVNAGQADACIQAVGAQLGTITSGNKVILRLYHEANGDWMNWSKNTNGSLRTAAQFKSQFQRTVDQLRIGGAFANGMVAIELNWAEGYFGNGDAFDELAAYPGDAYVDWVSSDAYATGLNEWCSRTQHHCELAEVLTHGNCVTPPTPELPQTGFECNATRVPVGTEKTYRNVKPYAIAETGRGENTLAPQGSWMRYAGSYISQRMPGVMGIAYFDFDARTTGETQNWRVDTNAAKLQGFKDWALMPKFLGS